MFAGEFFSSCSSPCVTVLGVGVAVAGEEITNSARVRSWSTEIPRVDAVGTEYTAAIEQERRLTLQRIGGDPQDDGLAEARRRTDAAIAALNGLAPTLTAFEPVMSKLSGPFAAAVARLAEIRARADSHQIPMLEAYAFYSSLRRLALAALDSLTQDAPVVESAVTGNEALRLAMATEAMDAGDALAEAAMHRGSLTPVESAEYSLDIGYYHKEIDSIVADLDSTTQVPLRALMSSPAWQGLVAIEQSVAQPASVPADVSPARQIDLRAWRSDADAVDSDLSTIWQQRHHDAVHLAADDAARLAIRSLMVGLGTSAAAMIAIAVALILSSRLIARLRKLRADTLARADTQLPDIMSRLHDGQAVDPDTELARLDLGTDEIGQVADAFNRAQLAALTAATAEARTRAGFAAFFLNIAHRTQTVVHRQLEILDGAEYRQDDPEQLEILFRLDQLATRQRRNAENLLILGGEQPGRRWRTPVDLTQLVRAAAAETEDYARVRITRLPDVAVVGVVVADLIHLVAELVDNATAFSPPETTVQITGGVVGRGVAIEVSDQGLGIPADQLSVINDTLCAAPDFSVASLSIDSRLGLFVVARLAAANGITVRLTESDYGGIRAIVIVPTSLIATDATAAEPTSAASRNSEAHTGS